MHKHSLTNINFSQKLKAKQESIEAEVAIIASSELRQANPDINKEIKRLLDEFTNSKTQLSEKRAKVEAQLEAFFQLDVAIDKLVECFHKQITPHLPVGPNVVGKVKKAEVSHCFFNALFVLVKAGCN